MKNLTLLILFLLFAVNIFSQTTYTPKDIAGEYIYSSGYVGASFCLKDDGSYEFRTFSDCCGNDWKEIGTYSIKTNLVQFKIIKYTLGQYNLFDPKEKAAAFKKFYPESDFKDEKIETEHEIHIVSWGERVYLLNYNDLYKFAAAVNLGFEPRGQIIHHDFLTTDFYLRSGDEKKIVSGKPNLPNEWLSYILDSPINASITKIEGAKHERKYTVNKGSKEGLKVGMCFIRENTKIDYENLVWVISVEEHSAILEVQSLIFPPDYKIGDILTTKSYKSPK
ncbi:MAG: rod shape-determining protein MreC [Pyrinomonadaceae bacterium]|nr:rod shape-determining protein MreC [Pyrinomonadaceae bacterium]